MSMHTGGLMDIKKFFYFVAFMLLTLPIAFAQSTTVTGTLVDPSGNVWKNAVITAQFQPTPNTPGPYTWSGGSYNPQPPAVVADGTGTFSISLPSNTAIVPSGSSWLFSIAPNATQAAAVVNVSLSGGTINIVPIITAFGAWPTGNISGTFVNKVYNTSQVGTVPLNQGAIVYNTTLSQLQFWNGSIWQQIGTSSGGSLPAAPQGSTQYANFGTTAFMGRMPLISDAFNTANNGITQAYALGCSTTACVITRPAGSTDTEISQPLLPSGGIFSSLVIDLTGNSQSMLSMNPISQNVNNFGIGPGVQQSSFNATTYSEANPGPVQGQLQVQQINISNFFSPGYSLGETGTLNPAQPQYTGGAALWAAPRGQINYYHFNGSGIQGAAGSQVFCSATGDCGGASSDFINYAGGFLVFGDEGGKGRDFHLSSQGDWIGTISSISDSYHLVATQSVNPGLQGQGRLLAQTTSPIFTQINMTSIIPPDSSNPAYVTFNENLPVSNFRGHASADCPLPIQMGTVATITNCDIITDSGTLTANTVPASSAANISNHWNAGMQVLSVAAGAPGHVIASFKANRPIPAGSYIFQGGLAGDVLTMDADDNTVLGVGNRSRGSVFPIVGSDLHRAYVVDYNASQVWATPPDPGSQARTTATTGIAFGGYNMVNLVRTAGVTKGTLTTGITAGQQYQLNGIKFYTVSGCTDATFNGVYSNVAYLDATDPAIATLIMPQPGQPDSTCAAASIHVQQTFADIYIAAEALDVENHTTVTVDGTFVHSYQPNFTNGGSVFQPQSYSSEFLGNQVFLNTGVPAKGAVGVNVLLNGYSSLSSDAVKVQASTSGNVLVAGSGGMGNTGNAFHVAGGQGSVPFANALVVDTPAALGNILNIGFVDSSCTLINSSTCPLFENYNVINIENGLFTQHWDSFVKLYAYCFLTCVNQATNLGKNGFGGFSLQSNSQIISTFPHLFTNPQFEALMTGGAFGDYEPVTQLRNPDPLGHPSGSVVYDNVSAAPVVTANTIPAGGTTYNWLFVIHTPFGDSFSPVNFVFNLSNTFTGSITMSCNNIGAGATADLYRFINPSFYQITSGTGHCTTNSGTVSDNGTSYGAAQSTASWSAGAPFYTGSIIAQGFKGFLGFTQGDIFGNTTPGKTITGSLNQVSAGNFCLNTTVVGNCAGNLQLNNLTVANCVGCGGSSGIANITIAMPTAALTANSCSAATATTMTGVLTTSAFSTAFTTDPSGVVGWGNSGGMVFVAWPTANTLNWRVCNQSSAGISPGAISINVGAK